MDRHGASLEQASAAFGVSATEIETARDLRKNGGGANLPIDIDVDSYGNPFASAPAGATSIRRPGKHAAETATKVVTAPKKRGRKGAKINEAFLAIGAEPIPAEEFANTRGVSLNVLRQAKRFDKSGLARVRVKKINGTLMVYRDADEE
jgi:hypothetical protein